MRMRPVALVLAIGTLGQAAPSLETLLDRLGAYLTTYELALSTMVADERFEQTETLQRWAAGDQTIPLLTKKRTLVSEVAFLRLPDGGAWFGVREVKTIDGRRTENDGPRLLDVLNQPSADARVKAEAIVRSSSGHSLGAPRTINMPTVPLEILNPRHRQRLVYRIAGTESVSGVKTTRLEFREIESPTLVRAADGQELLSFGTAWVEADSGQLWQVELGLSPSLVTARAVAASSVLRVTFTLNANLGLVVPREMTEKFETTDSRFQGRARYSNFRRFGTSARIIP